MKRRSTKNRNHAEKSVVESKAGRQKGADWNISQAENETLPHSDREILIFSKSVLNLERARANQLTDLYAAASTSSSVLYASNESPHAPRLCWFAQHKSSDLTVLTAETVISLGSC